MASTLAQQVNAEIGKLARSDIPLAKRRAEAAKRIDQFKADLAEVRHQPGAAEGQKENLRRVLQRAATRHDLTTEENSIYAEALDALMGHAR
jgi:chromosome segregation ATPase